MYKDKKGYVIIYIAGQEIKLHIYIWEKANYLKPIGYEIHHIDENKENYRIDNLVLLSNSDHKKLHAGWKKTKGEWTHKICSGCYKILSLIHFYKRKGYTPSAKCKFCHKKQTRQWAIKNPKKRKSIALKYYYKKKGEANA